MMAHRDRPSCPAGGRPAPAQLHQVADTWCSCASGARRRGGRVLSAQRRVSSVHRSPPLLRGRASCQLLEFAPNSARNAIRELTPVRSNRASKRHKRFVIGQPAYSPTRTAGSCCRVCYSSGCEPDEEESSGIAEFAAKKSDGRWACTGCTGFQRRYCTKLRRNALVSNGLQRPVDTGRQELNTFCVNTFCAFSAAVGIGLRDAEVAGSNPVAPTST